MRDGGGRDVTAASGRIAAERAAAAQLAADTAREVEEMILGQRPAPVVGGAEVRRRIVTKPALCRGELTLWRTPGTFRT